MLRALVVASLAAISCPAAFSYNGEAYKGWPSSSQTVDLRESFVNPPKGYGNVPFYWWTGDSLDINRLTEQLEILSDASTDGLCISYNHTHFKVDTALNAAGHGNCGRVSGGVPRVFSKEWREIWNEFSARCAEKGIGLGMDDYVVAWPKNGEFIDSVLAEPAIRDYRGALVEVGTAKGEAAPDSALTVLSETEDSVVYICTAKAPWLAPGLGAEIVRRYFQPFVDNMDEKGLKGMNYFFQDELQYGLNMHSWAEDMPEQFLARKGYDIVPLLPALFRQSGIDSADAAVRLDYAEVLTCLSEERYFKPIFDWNADKGLIYGCDPEGRGLRPTQYLDYFRAISWFTAPGNDAPARGSSFRQTKVSSSIAHLYGRPRTWLEAFHSMGWDANGALLRRQLDHHLVAGGNLLCMHGLYYSTHGGWWEWAPPCFHFRMPYWPHMKKWLKYAERMCFVLSQGSHVCDIAVMYPTETMQAFPGAGAESTFKMSDELSVHGLDYDFIDYRSLQRGEVTDGRLGVAGESYRVLVLVDTRAMHEESLRKVREFAAAGGVVLAVGDVADNIRELSTVSAATPAEARAAIMERIDPDFSTTSGMGRVLHRRIGMNDVYMFTDVPSGDTVRFRAQGRAEVWDAMEGTTGGLAVIGTDGLSSSIRYVGEDGGAMLVVFSPGEPERSSTEESRTRIGEMALDGPWDICIMPTMNNRWGDFRLPAEDGFIGVEARSFDGEVYGYGPYMQTRSESTGGEWVPYVWSWQYGVPDSPGAQGWHGLKAKVDPRFLILDGGGRQEFRTRVYAPRKATYKVVVEGVVPDEINVDGTLVTGTETALARGWHSLSIAYEGTVKSQYELGGKRGEFLDDRARSMVVFMPKGAEVPAGKGIYDSIVASKWYGAEVLPYSVGGEPGESVFRFETAPGAETLRFKVNGSLRSVKVDGLALKVRRDGGWWTATLSDHFPGVREVEVTGKPRRGYPGAAFFAEPVRMECAKGRMPAGDWTAFGAMRYYSGAVSYSRRVYLDSHYDRVVLDLGDVDATCEVSINGSEPKILIGKPYRLDVTPFVKEGANTVEVVVRSSLANHYSTIPTPYRGKPGAGLMGPVKMIFYADGHEK